MCTISVDGNWSQWTEWEECTVTCGGGAKQRKRMCNDPEPQHGGQECFGNGTDNAICNIQFCPSTYHLFIVLGTIIVAHKYKRFLYFRYNEEAHIYHIEVLESFCRVYLSPFSLNRTPFFFPLYDIKEIWRHLFYDLKFVSRSNNPRLPLLF